MQPVSLVNRISLISNDFICYRWELSDGLYLDYPIEGTIKAHITPQLATTHVAFQANTTDNYGIDCPVIPVPLSHPNTLLSADPVHINGTSSGISLFLIPDIFSALKYGLCNQFLNFLLRIRNANVLHTQCHREWEYDTRNNTTDIEHLPFSRGNRV